MDRDLHRAHAEFDDRHWWFIARRQIIRETLRRHCPEGVSEVIDVGCGAGGLLPMLQGFGSVTGLEADVTAAATAAERNPDADVLHGTIADVSIDLPAVDLITAFDVIEHVDDDVGMLHEMRGHLAPDGRLCVTVPALPWLWSAHDVANQHRRRYTARSLRRSIEGAGYHVEHLSYFNTFLLPLVAMSRLVDRLRRVELSGDFARSLGPLDRVLQAVFASERFIVPRRALPLGVSLIAVARQRS